MLTEKDFSGEMSPESLKRQGEEAGWDWLLMDSRDELRMTEGRGTLPPEIQLKGMCSQCEQKLLSANEAPQMLSPHFVPVKRSFKKLRS